MGQLSATRSEPLARRARIGLAAQGRDLLTEKRTALVADRSGIRGDLSRDQPARRDGPLARPDKPAGSTGSKDEVAAYHCQQLDVVKLGWVEVYDDVYGDVDSRAWRRRLFG